MVLSRFGELHGKYQEKVGIKHVICSVVVLSRFDDLHVKYHNMQTKSAICSIMVLSCFGDFHGKTRKK